MTAEHDFRYQFQRAIPNFQKSYHLSELILRVLVVVFVRLFVCLIACWLVVVLSSFFGGWLVGGLGGEK